MIVPRRLGTRKSNVSRGVSRNSAKIKRFLNFSKAGVVAGRLGYRDTHSNENRKAEQFSGGPIACILYLISQNSYF